jgi:hypothetical protein
VMLGGDGVGEEEGGGALFRPQAVESSVLLLGIELRVALDERGG